MIDEIDIKILSILQNSGRTHLAEIAKEVELSSPAVLERVKKLESSGIIKGYQAVLDPKKMGKDVTAFVGVSVSHQKYIDAFAAFIGRQRDVLECHHVTGEESFILKVKTANTDSLEKILAEVRSLEGVSGTVTKVVLSSVKESQKLEFDNGLAAHAKKRNGANHRKTGTGS